ncbi:MAG: hypothetical protein ABI384_05380 [Allobranchiibius sp.]
MTRRWLIVCAVALLAAFGGLTLTSWMTQRAPLQSISQPGPTVLVRVPTIDWNSTSVQANPTLYALARRGAVAAMLTRNIAGHSCTNDSWLTLSAGTRTSVGAVVQETLPGQPVGSCPAVPKFLNLDAGTVQYPYWARWRQIALSRSPKADIGRLASTAALSNQCVLAVGSGAALGAVDREGVVTHYAPGVAQADFNECSISLVSLTTTKDSVLRQVIDRLPQNATVIVAALADDATPEHVRAVVVAGPGVPHGRMTSLNTRQPGLIATPDLSALLLHRFGADAPNLPEGRMPSVEPTGSVYGSVRLSRDLGQELAVQHSVLRSFFPRSLVIGAAILGLGILVWRWLVHRVGRGKRVRAAHPSLRGAIALTAGALSALPVATFAVGLVPWYRSSHPGIALTVSVLLIAILIPAVALVGPWRKFPGGPLIVILAVTWYVVVDDTTHGSRLQLTSMMGLEPVYGGRFYGMGNVGYAMLATSGLLLAALLADPLIRAGRRDLAALTVILFAVPSILVDGYPWWGADGGGPAAMIPAFAYLALNAAGLKVTWRRVGITGGATVVVVGALAVIDYLRPVAYRTHLGDFVAGLRDGGKVGGLGRILTLNEQMVTSSPLTLFVPVLLIVAIIVLIAPGRRLTQPVSRLWDRLPFLGNGLVACVICWVIGFFANDSGTAIPPVGMLISVPLLVVLSTWAGRSQTGTALAGPSGASAGKGSRTIHPGVPNSD